MIIVITEKNTIEGYTAGWVAVRALKGNCQWIQIGQGDPMPALGPDDDVLMFGVSYSRRKIEEMQDKTSPRRVKSLFVFDNDFQVKAQLSGVKNVKINLKQTAARMAWEHLRADLRVKTGKDKKTEFHHHSAPWLVDYSEIKGVWKWASISPFFVKKAIESAYKQTLESWDDLSTRDLGGLEMQGKDIAKEEAAKEPEPEKEPEEEKEESNADQNQKEPSGEEPEKESGSEGAGESGDQDLETEEKTEEKKDDGSKASGKKKNGRKNKGATGKPSH